MRFGDNTDDDSGTDNGDGSGEKRAHRKAGELLSFIPKTYSLKCDGRIEAVQVYGIQKRYRPEKHYVFILKITRENEREATFLFRYNDLYFYMRRPQARHDIEWPFTPPPKKYIFCKFLSFNFWPFFTGLLLLKVVILLWLLTLGQHYFWRGYDWLLLNLVVNPVNPRLHGSYFD